MRATAKPPDKHVRVSDAGSSPSLELARMLLKSRPVELVYAGGLPIIGFLAGVDAVSDLWRIWLMIGATAPCGWHILIVNDICFPGSRLGWRTVLPALACPVAGMVVALSYGYATASVLLLAMIINWDVYACLTKRYFANSLLHNFMGGFLHVATGAAFTAIATSDLLFIGVYFGLTMVGASMQHDAGDCEEDGNAGYNTGAVLFGRRVWGYAAIFPIAAANILLLFHPGLLRSVFVPVFLVYVIVCFGVLARARDDDVWLGLRLWSRLIYGIGGSVYIMLRLRELA